MVNAWNTLPGMVVEADIMVEFKRLLDRDMEVWGMEGYGHLQAEKISLTWYHVQH